MGSPRYCCALLACLLLTPLPASAQANNSLRKGFPNLDGQFKVVERSNQDYNCVAYTLGITNQWIDPKTGPANAPFSFMDQIYNKNGYQRTNALDLKNDSHLQRVAVYGKVNADGSIKEITHAALQNPDGSWSSKLGHLPLIRHANPYAVDGPTYGVPVATYVRPITQANATNAGGNTANVSPMAGQNKSGFANPQLAKSAGNTGGPKNSHTTHAHGAGAKQSGAFGNALQLAGRNIASNGDGRSIRINGGIHIHGAGADAINLDAFAGASIRINGGIHINGSSFASAFRAAGQCTGGDGEHRQHGKNNGGNFAGNSFARNAGNFAPDNALNAKNAGNSLNSLSPNNTFANNSAGGNGRNNSNTLAPSNAFGKGANNAGNTRNTSAGASNRGPLANAFHQVGAHCDPGKSSQSAANNNAFANNSRVKSGAGSPVSNAAANAKNAGLALNAPLAKNTANGQALNTGAAKNAGNSLNSLVANTGSARNAGNTRNSSGPGNLVGANIRVNINGNNNVVTINYANPIAKSANNAQTNFSHAKNAGNTSNQSTVNHGLAKNLGNANNVANTLANTKGAANTTRPSNALSPNAKNNGPTRSTNSIASNNKTGNLVGNKAVNKTPTNNLASARNAPSNLVGNKAANKTPTNNLASVKNAPGNLVGNKAVNKTPTNNLASARNAPSNLVGNKSANKTPTNNLASAKNSPGNLVGNKAANKTPTNNLATAKNGPGNLVGNKAANKTPTNNLASAKNSPGNLVGNKSANKTPTNNLASAKIGAGLQNHQGIAKNAAAMKPAVAKNTPINPATSFAGANKNGGGVPKNTAKNAAPVSNKSGPQQAMAPAVARNAAGNQANFKPAQVKTGPVNMPNRTVAMNMPTQQRAPIKFMPQRQVMPNIARSTPFNNTPARRR